MSSELSCWFLGKSFDFCLRCLHNGMRGMLWLRTFLMHGMQQRLINNILQMDWGDGLLFHGLSRRSVYFGKYFELVSAVQSHLRDLLKHRLKLYFVDVCSKLFLPQ